MRNELKPCPSCGNTELWSDTLINQFESGLFAYCIRCECGMEYTTPRWLDSEEEAKEQAVKAWNACVDHTCTMEHYEGTGTCDYYLCNSCNNLVLMDWNGSPKSPKFCSNCGARVTAVMDYKRSIKDVEIED